MSQDRYGAAIYVVAAVVVTAVVLVGVAGVAGAAGNEITDLSSPTAAAEGDYPQVEAEAEMVTQAGTTAELQVLMYNPETGEAGTICSDTANLAASGTKTLSCSGEFTMPGNDVEVQARLLFQSGQVIEEETVDVDLVENPGDGGGDDGDDSDNGDDDGSGGGDEGGDTGDGDNGDSGDDEDGWLSGIKNGVKNALTAVFVEPFRALGRALLDIYTHVIQTFPQVDDNPAIEEVHNLTLAVALTLGSASLMIVGLLFMTGPMFGISYQQVKLVLPRIVVAMAFGTVSLPLLQLGIDFFDVLTEVFKPSDPAFHEVLNFSIGLIIIAVVQAALLLAVVIMFVLIDIYVVFVAAISPLIALAWAVPKTKQYADRFIASWWAALAVAPLSMLVVRTSLALLQSYPEQSPSWLLGIGMPLMLLFIPKMLYQSSIMMMGVGYQAVSATKQTVRDHGDTFGRVSEVSKRGRYHVSQRANHLRRGLQQRWQHRDGGESRYDDFRDLVEGTKFELSSSSGSDGGDSDQDNRGDST